MENLINNPDSNSIPTKPTSKQEPSHSSAKRVRGPTGIYSKLLPIDLNQPSSFINKLLPSLRPIHRSPKSLVISGKYEKISNSIWIPTSDGMILWQRGFFGKGSLSRSEPTWLQRAKNRRILEVLEDDRYLKLTAEELTAKRRVERRETKIQKSKLKQLTGTNESIVSTSEKDELILQDQIVNNNSATSNQKKNFQVTLPTELELEVHAIEDSEHLQLMNEEAFFLSFGLGCLDVTLEENESDSEPLTILQLWNLFCRAALRGNQDQMVRPDNPFILSYVVYHHFRSLGWVVRSGIKFCADWVLYGSKGPVGGHAEFAVCMIPIHADGTPAEQMEDRTSWRWLSTVNRVCAGVKKTLILVHVIIPNQFENDDLESPQILTKYTIKEIALKRFIPARMRD